MNTLVKVAAFAAAVALVFGGAWAVGDQVGPVGTVAEEQAMEHSSSEPEGHDEAAGHSGDELALPGGLAVAADGYRLVLVDSVLAQGTRPVSFTIQGPDGRPVTAYDVEHEKRLHLIVVRRDFSGFQHVHPTLDEGTGLWTAPVGLTPGQWRVFADFAPTGGEPVTLGGDLLVPGETAAPESVEETRADTVDGYTVAVEGELRAGEVSTLTLEVSEAGAPVRDLQPYLGAYGHLVALRDGDLAYLHVHPGGEPGDGETEPGPVVEFGVEVPSAGRYHLYLDFRHQGVVRTAHLVLDADGEAAR